MDDSRGEPFAPFSDRDGERLRDDAEHCRALSEWAIAAAAHEADDRADRDD